MRLPVAQRSSVILMDVLGCSLQEVCDVMDYSLPAVKAALHRGRTRLRELAEEADDAPRPATVGGRSRHGFPPMSPFQCARFRRHPCHDRRRRAARARQQDTDERARPRCRAISAIMPRSSDWHLVPGSGGGPPGDPGVRPERAGRRPKYFMLVDWSADKVATIRDFRHAPYVDRWRGVLTYLDRDSAAASAATNVAPKPALYFLPSSTSCELWCSRPAPSRDLSRRFYGPKPASRLLAVGDFAHKTARNRRIARLA